MRPILVAALLGACGGGDGGASDAGTRDAVTTDAPATTRHLRFADIIAPVTPDELANLGAEWASRDISAREVSIVSSGTLTLGSTEMAFRVVEHTVGSSRHFGVVLVPTALAGPAPVLIYAHGGFTGEAGLPPFQVESLAERIPDEPLRSQLVYVIPSYRGERIEVAAVAYSSPGETLIGTTDLTDTAALLSVALALTPEADATRVGIFGESRGGLVALALGARDDRIDLVIDAFAPTDFRIPLASIEPSLYLDSVAAAVADPTNPSFLLVRSLVPLDQVTVAGDMSLTITSSGYTELRRRMAATSAVAAPLSLPATQVHHGTADMSATVAYSRALSNAMSAAGRPSPSDEFTYFEYEGGDHSLASLPGAVDQIGAVISQALTP